MTGRLLGRTLTCDETELGTMGNDRGPHTVGLQLPVLEEFLSYCGHGICVDHVQSLHYKGQIQGAVTSTEGHSHTQTNITHPF